MDSRAPLQTSLRRLVVATVVLYVSLAAVVAFVWVSGTSQRNDIQALAEQMNGALCEVRFSLEDRVAASKAFLRQHPNGIEGISREDILRGIADTQRTVDALGGLDCPER